MNALPFLTGALAFGFALLGLVLWLARRMGRLSALLQRAKKESDHAKARHEIDEAVRALSDAELDSELERLRRGS